MAFTPTQPQSQPNNSRPGQRPGFNRQQRNRNHRNNRPPSEFEEKVVQVNRVSKKTKGGNSIGFSVLVVVGDRQGKVGVGLGKGPDVLSSIQKASRKAKKHLTRVPIKNSTIPFSVTLKKGAAKVLLKPAPEGTGVIAGGAVRAVVEAAGIQNIVSKIMGTNNQASNVYATFAALQHIRQLADKKGIKLESKPKKTQPRLSPPQAKHLAPKKALSKSKTKPDSKTTPKSKPQTKPKPATVKPQPAKSKKSPTKKTK